MYYDNTEEISLEILNYTFSIGKLNSGKFYEKNLLSLIFRIKKMKIKR